MATWSTSTCKNQTQENKTNNDNDFDTREVEFEFSKEFNTEVVDEDNGDQKDGNEDSRVDFFSRYPVLDDQTCCCKVIGSDNDVLCNCQSSVS